jgi:hypothetical protein
MRIGWICLLLAACGDDGVSASISGVNPPAAFTGRTTRVTVSGFGTGWTEEATVDFGDGVTVGEIVAASPTALVATLTVDDAAAPGPRDVVVGQGGQTLTYAQGFTLEAPLAVEVTGTPAQGSVIDVTVRSRAFDLVFDDTAFSLDLGLGIRTVEGTLLVSPFEATAQAVVDVDVRTGPRDVVVSNGPPEAAVLLRAPGGLDVQARTPTPLKLGASVSGLEDEPFGTQLYSLTPNAGHVVDLRASAANPMAEPSVAVLPASGSFLDVLAFSYRDFFEAGSESTFYLVYVDRSGTSEYSYTLRASQVMPVTRIDEASPEVDNDTYATATLGGALPLRLAAVLESASDQDWYAIDIAPADGGRTLTVGTYGGDYRTDTVIEVFGADGTTRLGESADDVYLDSLDVPTVAGGGRHYLKLSYSPDGFSAADTRYRAIVKLE